MGRHFRKILLDIFQSFCNVRGLPNIEISYHSIIVSSALTPNHPQQLLSRGCPFRIHIRFDLFYSRDNIFRVSTNIASFYIEQSKSTWRTIARNVLLLSVSWLTLTKLWWNDTYHLRFMCFQQFIINWHIALIFTCIATIPSLIYMYIKRPLTLHVGSVAINNLSPLEQM